MIRMRPPSSSRAISCFFLSRNVAGFDCKRAHSTFASPLNLTNQLSSSKPFPPSPPPPPSLNVAIFWDLQTTQPPSTVSAYDAAVRLRLAVSRFGPVCHSIAFCPPSSPRRRPLSENRKSFPSDPCVCGVCGRRFFDRPKLLAHFKELHQREHAKRLRRLESAKGARRVNLAASMAAKMDKYRKAADALFATSSCVSNEAGIVVSFRGGAVFELAGELRRAGVRVRRVPAGISREVACRALKEHVGEVVARRAAGCLVLVSSDPELVEIVRDARACGIKTVVVGDGDSDSRHGGRGEGGLLKRWADAGFTWREVLSGKTRDEAPKVIGRWKDAELLSRLEWKYQPEEEHQNDDYGEFDQDVFEKAPADEGDGNSNNSRTQMMGGLGGIWVPVIPILKETDLWRRLCALCELPYC